MLITSTLVPAASFVASAAVATSGSCSMTDSMSGTVRQIGRRGLENLGSTRGDPDEGGRALWVSRVRPGGRGNRVARDEVVQPLCQRSGVLHHEEVSDLRHPEAFGVGE